MTLRKFLEFFFFFSAVRNETKTFSNIDVDDSKW